MFDFDYCNPTRIVFGKDRLGELNDYIDPSARVLVLYGGGSVKKYATLDKVMAGLGKRFVMEFGGIEANPQYETLMKAVDVIKDNKIDFLLAVGGGSVIDGTKFISAAVYFETEAFQILYGHSEKIQKAMPFGAVLTLPATGTEMNSNSVVCHLDAKIGFASDLVYPKFSFLDPTLTFTLPKIQVANGVVDTFIHVMEQYIRGPVNARVQDRHSEGIMTTLIEIAQTTINEADNYDARATLMWCATNALNGWIGLGQQQDWMTHTIGHELTAEYGIDHGQTLAIIMPSLLTQLLEDRKNKLVQWGERVWNITEGSEEERASLAISSMVAFFEGLGIHTKMSDYGIGEEFIPIIVERLKKHGAMSWLASNKVTEEVLVKILEGAK
jgi:NADP-dependent alcohol dehydrogenase